MRRTYDRTRLHRALDAVMDVRENSHRDPELQEAFAEYVNKSNAALTEFCRQRGVKPIFRDVKLSMVDALMRQEFGVPRYNKFIGLRK